MLDQLMEMTHFFTLILPFQHRVHAEMARQGHVVCVCECVCERVCVCYTASVILSRRCFQFGGGHEQAEMIRGEEIGGLGLSAWTSWTWRARSPTPLSPSLSLCIRPGPLSPSPWLSRGVESVRTRRVLELLASLRLSNVTHSSARLSPLLSSPPSSLLSFPSVLPSSLFSHLAFFITSYFLPFSFWFASVLFLTLHRFCFSFPPFLRASLPLFFLKYLSFFPLHIIFSFFALNSFFCSLSRVRVSSDFLLLYSFILTVFPSLFVSQFNFLYF